MLSRGRVIGLGAVALANSHPRRFMATGQRLDRVIDPLVSKVVQVALRAEGDRVSHAFGPLIDERTLFSREWPTFLVLLDEVLLDLRSNSFEQVAHVTDDGEVAANGVLGLHHVEQSEHDQRQDHYRGPRRGRGPKGGRRSYRRGRCRRGDDEDQPNRDVALGHVLDAQ